MHQAGFLVVTVPLKSAIECIGNHLITASKHVRQRLYVKVEAGRGPLWPPSERTHVKMLSRHVPAFYDSVCRNCSHLDVRLILRSNCDQANSPQIDVILTDSSDCETNIRKYAKEHFDWTCLNVVRLSDPPHIEEEEEEDELFATYNNVILGGTFDRLHNGHKLLLTSALLRTRKKLTVGVTEGAMLKRKFLWELIEPVEKRINDVTEFLKDVEPDLEYLVVPIYDTFGPSIEDPDLNCIVVSDETKRGGDSVNVERVRRNMKPLDMVTVNLIPDPSPRMGDEDKMSSSNQRRSLLGTYLRQPPVTVGPLRIALIGALHSENCCLIEEFKKLGAHVIDCERLLCQLLASDADLFNRMRHELGTEGALLLGDVVDKAKLCVALLEHKAKWKMLSSFIGQKMQPLVQKEIDARNKDVTVLKLPSFLEAESLTDVHQVWGVVVPESQLLKSLIECCSVPEEVASKLLTQLSSNLEIVKLSHMIFSLHGDSAFVAQQVRKTWKLLDSKTKEPEDMRKL